MNYPFFLKPGEIDNIFNGKYLESITIIPRKPQQPYLEDGVGFFAGALMYIGGSVVALCICGMIFSKDSQDVGTVFKIIGGATLAIFLGVGIGSSVKNSRKEEFERKKAQYDKEKNLYDKKLSISNKIETDIKYLSQIEKKSYLLNYYYQENTIKPELSHSTYKEGKSEQMFYEILSKVFGDSISKGHIIVKYYLYDNSFENSLRVKDVYLPDIVYYNPKSGVCIDIEIDERIEKSTGKVIHKFNDDSEVKRNTFFTKNGWFVLRFAEEQILNNKGGCILYLLKVIEQFDPEFIKKDIHNELLSTNKVTELSSLKRW